MRAIPVIGGFCLLLMLFACVMPPSDTGKGFMFDLSSVKEIVQKPSDLGLIVALPVTATELDTYRIALSAGKGRWDYYAGARWAEFLPALVQDRLTKSIENAKLFKSVTTDQTGLGGDYILKTEIRTFQAEYVSGAKTPLIQVRIVANLLSRLERTPIASFEALAIKKATDDRLPAIQSAFDAAFAEAQKQVVHHLVLAMK